MPAPTADTANATGPLTITEAANRFEAMMDAPKGAQPKAQAPKAKEPPTPADEDEVEAQADQGDGETPAEVDPEGETEEGADEEDSAAVEGDEAPDDTEEPLYTVKVDGKEEKVPLTELVKGYSRQADYSRKTAALSEEAKATREERQAVQAERAQYAQLLEALAGQLEESMGQEPNWQKLYDENPLEYVRQKDLWRETQERRAMVAHEQTRIQEAQEQETAARVQEMVKQGREKLVEAIPAWKDKARWDADRAKLREYGKTLGFSEDELGAAYDHRAVVALYKAMRYDDLMAKKPVPAPTNAPKVLRPGAPQVVSGKRTSEITRAKQRLAQTGRVQDAAKYFESLL